MKKKLIIAIVAMAIIYVALAKTGRLPESFKAKSVVPQAVDLSAGQAVTEEAVQLKADDIQLPSSQPASLSSPVIRVQTIPWNATMGYQYAVGGTQTTKGSLMERNGIKVQTERQDDTEKMKQSQLQFASALAEGQAQPSVGSHFVVIMGDGSAQYIASLNDMTKKLGDEYAAQTFGALGYSRGEDGCYGPQEWKDNPQAAKGGVIAAYLRDGDWNLCMFWMAQNGLKNNPDETTYDPDAINWISTSDFMTAVKVYVSPTSETRKVVKDGKLTGETKEGITAQGVATWTPGDVALAKQKGGLVRLISTKENAYQMPATVVGIKKWIDANPKLVDGFLEAALEGGKQVKTYEKALSFAGRVSANVYADQTPAYWVKYYKGSKERDKTGNLVELGGSTTMNLADNLLLFGLTENSGGLSSSLFNATYSGFGNVVKQQYPKLFPSFPSVDKAVNLGPLKRLMAKNRPKDTDADTSTFTEAAPIASESVIAKKNWSITFDTGKATFSPSATATLDDLYNQLLIGGALAIDINGHTDNIGDPASNLRLSGARANAVKEYLEARNRRLFPEGRIHVSAFGQNSPIAPNETAEGRAKNRRVTIILGTQD